MHFNTSPSKFESRFEPRTQTPANSLLLYSKRTTQKKNNDRPRLVTHSSKWLTQCEETMPKVVFPGTANYTRGKHRFLQKKKFAVNLMDSDGFWLGLMDFTMQKSMSRPRISSSRFSLNKRKIILRRCIRPLRILLDKASCATKVSGLSRKN